MAWRLLPTLSAPMPLQMALDELLFDTQKKDPQAPVLRFYVSSEPWISVGCSFKGSDPVLGKRGLTPLILRNPNVPITKRITGGGCVLHGRDLIFSLSARYEGTGSVSEGNGACPSRPGKGAGTILEDQKWSQSPLSTAQTSYAKIHESVSVGFQACGLVPKFYGAQEELPKGSDCFDFPVESDLAWKGMKIAGGAQKRSEGVLLHHESITIPENVGRDQLLRAIRQGFEQVFGVVTENADLDPGLYFQAERFMQDKSQIPIVAV